MPSRIQVLNELSKRVNSLRDELQGSSLDLSNEVIVSRLETMIDHVSHALAGPVASGPVASTPVAASATMKCPHCGNAVRVRVSK